MAKNKTPRRKAGSFIVWKSSMSRNRSFPSNLALLGYLLSALLVIIYLGRLIVLDAKSPLILAPAALAGLIVNPAWYIWLGMVLRNVKRDA